MRVFTFVALRMFGWAGELDLAEGGVSVPYQGWHSTMDLQNSALPLYILLNYIQLIFIYIRPLYLYRIYIRIQLSQGRAGLDRLFVIDFYRNMAIPHERHMATVSGKM